MSWKKLIVSGAQAELQQLTVDNTITANSFAGSGASITGVVHNSGEIASDISGSFTALSSSIATRFDGLTSDYTELTNIPGGILSSSAQVNALGVNYTTLSNIPAGIISSSTQIDLNFFDIDGLVSSSTQVVSSLNNQDTDFGTGEVTASAFSGDGSGLTNITVTQNATVESTFSNATSHTVTHNFGNKNVLVSVYDASDNLFIPNNIRTTNANQVEITFDASSSGRVVVARGGHIVSGSIPYTNLTAVPSGIVSSSAQIDALFNIDGLVSSSVLSSPSQGTARLTTNGSQTDVDLGLQTSDSPTFTNLTLTGDLTVEGTTTSIQTENLLVEDKFILLNSGSSAADGGIVINGAGAALGWDNSEGRFALDSAGALANQTSISTDAFVAGVVDIDAGHSDISAYQKNGNIKVDSGTIYIYS